MNSFNLLSRIWLYLDRNLKFELVFALFLSILCAFSEIFTLATAIPFLKVLTNGTKNIEDPLLLDILNYLKINQSKQIVVLFSLLFIISTLCCAFVRFYNLKKNNYLSAKIGSFLACKAFLNILYQPYGFHLDIKSSSIISTLTTQLNLTVQSINQFLLLITSLLISLSILTSLFIINFNISLFIFITIGISYLLITVYFKKKLIRNTTQISSSSKGQVKSLQEGLGAIKEILLYRNQNFFIKKFKNQDETLRRHISSNIIISIFPRYFIEAFAFITIAFIALLLTLNLNEKNSIIPLLGVFVLGAQRLLPSIQQIYYGFATVKGNQMAIYDVLSILKLKTNKKFNTINKNKKFNLKKGILLKNISFKYPNSSKFTIKDLSFSIKKGEKIGIIGLTGSGKSTLVDILNGLLSPTSGSMFIDDIDIFKTSNKKYLYHWRNSISHVPQRIYLLDGTILENITIGDDPEGIDINYVKECCEAAQISEFINGSRLGLNTIVGERGIKISGGQSQRICIARAIYKKSKVIILDEATSAVDNKTESNLMESIEKISKNKIIVLVAHRLSTIKKCDKVIEISDGRIKRIGKPDVFL